jgi:hypothetical protein
MRRRVVSLDRVKQERRIGQAELVDEIAYLGEDEKLAGLLNHEGWDRIRS